MSRAWFSQHRSLALTALSSIVVTAIVATAAVVSTGYSAEKIDLQDASVWVSNSAESAVGRINTEVRELNSVVPAVGSDTQTLQDGSTVLIVDQSDATVDIVDPATSTISDSVPLPPNDPQVLLTHTTDTADATVVIVARATGELWTVPLATLSTFDAEDAPALTLGADVVTSMDESGQIFVYSPDTAAVYGILADDAGTVTSTDPLEVGEDAELSITSVGGRWAVLDSQSL
ncbi:MAG TPA: fibronectin type III domain-containing protein, partial [Glaciihabitans sp.]|nr:fibronectin type III domain-containing protein [Glaciihabitans sp.]